VGRGFVWVIVGIFETLCFFLTLSYDEAPSMIAFFVCLSIPIMAYSAFWIPYVIEDWRVHCEKAGVILLPHHGVYQLWVEAGFP